MTLPSLVMNRLSQNMYINAPTLSQLAACEAFSCEDELQANLQVYAANREVVLSALDELGLGDCASPADGAFYVYLDLSSKGVTDAPALCKRYSIARMCRVASMMFSFVVFLGY